MIFEFLVLLVAIFLGVRLGGLALGLMGGVGLAILAWGVGVPITAPPMDVILLIMTVVTASASLQAAGGLDFLVFHAERILRAKPQLITFLAPLIAFSLTFFAGTGHVAYALLPIISDVARQSGVRPERPLTVSVIASQLAISASPLSAATVAALGLLSDHQVTLPYLLSICVPSTLCGIICASVYANFMGKDLADDSYCQEFMAKKEKETIHKLAKSTTSKTPEKGALWATLCFGLAIGLIIALGVDPDLRPWAAGDPPSRLGMGPIIAVIMLVTASLILLISRKGAHKIAETSVFKAGIQAIIAIFGVAWLGDTFISHNIGAIKQSSANLLAIYPELFGVIFFGASILIYSQAATIRALLPLGLMVGIPPQLLTALLPAANGLFVIPNYPTVIAAIEFDETGSTRVGKYLLNHSFLIPGLIAIFVTIGTGIGLSYLIT